MTNRDSILKSRDITLSTKVCLVKATVYIGTQADRIVFVVHLPSCVLLNCGVGEDS